MGVMLELTGLSRPDREPSDWAIRAVMSVMPALLLGAATLLLRFRLGEAEHRAVRAMLDDATGPRAGAPAV